MGCNQPQQAVEKEPSLPKQFQLAGKGQSEKDAVDPLVQNILIDEVRIGQEMAEQREILSANIESDFYQKSQKEEEGQKEQKQLRVIADEPINGEINQPVLELKEQNNNKNEILALLGEYLPEKNPFITFLGEKTFTKGFQLIENSSKGLQQRIDGLELFLDFVQSLVRIQSSQPKEQFVDASLFAIEQYARKELKFREMAKHYQGKQYYRLICRTKNQNIQSSTPERGLLDLKVDQLFSECFEVLKLVRKLIEFNKNCFCFMTSYLIQCCLLLEQAGVDVREIENLLNKKLNQLSNFPLVNGSFSQILNSKQEWTKNYGQKNPQAESPIFGRKLNEQAQKKHPSFKVSLSSNKKVFFAFKEGSSNRVKQLHRFISERIERAEGAYRKFNRFLKDVTEKHAWQFLLEIVGKDQQSIRQIQDEFMNLSFDRQLSEGFTKIQQFIAKEETQVNKQKEEIYQFIEGQIEFKVGSLLSASCQFQSVGQINVCVDAIKRMGEERGLELVGLENRLLMEGLKEVVISLHVEEVICEIHMVLLKDLASKMVENYMNKLICSNRYSALWLLLQLNQKLSQNYLFESNVDTWRISKSQSAAEWEIQAEKYLKRVQRPLVAPLEQSRGNNGICSQVVQEIKDKLGELLKVSEKITAEQNLYALLCLTVNIKYNLTLKRYTEVEEGFHQFLRLLFDRNNKLVNKIEQKGPFSIEEKQSLYIYSSVLEMSTIEKLKIGSIQEAVEASKEFIKIAALLPETIRQQKIILARKTIAKGFWKLGHLNQALASFQVCIEAITEIGNPSWAQQRIQIEMLMGKVLIEQGNTLKGLEHLNIAGGECLEKDTGDYKIESEIFKQIGLVFLKTREYQESLLYLSKAFKILSAVTGSKSIQSIQLALLIGSVYQAQNKSDVAIQIYCTCLEITAQRYGDESFNLVSILYCLGRVLEATLMYQSACNVYKYCLNIIGLQKERNSEEYGECCLKLGENYYWQNNYSLSVTFLEKALVVKQKMFGKQSFHCAEVVEKILLNYEHIKNQVKQEYYLQKLRSIASTMKLTESPARLKSLQKSVSESLREGNYSLAVERSKKSLQILQKAKGRGSLETINALKQLGQAYLLQGEPDKAKENYKQCLNILQRQKGNDNMERAQILFFIGQAQERQEENNKVAEGYFREALRICVKFKIKYWVYAMCCLRLGYMLEKQQKLIQAYDMLKQSLPILEKMNSPEKKAVEKKIKEMKKYFQLGNQTFLGLPDSI